MVAELVWHGMGHQHRLASALEDGKEILEETLLDMLDKLARPDDIGLAGVLRAIGEVVHHDPLGRHDAGVTRADHAVDPDRVDAAMIEEVANGMAFAAADIDQASSA